MENTYSDKLNYGQREVKVNRNILLTLVMLFDFPNAASPHTDPHTIYNTCTKFFDDVYIRREIRRLRKKPYKNSILVSLFKFHGMCCCSDLM